MVNRPVFSAAEEAFLACASAICEMTQPCCFLLASIVDDRHVVHLHVEDPEILWRTRIADQSVIICDNDGRARHRTERGAAARTVDFDLELLGVLREGIGHDGHIDDRGFLARPETLGLGIE